jgi:putative membrane protein
MLMLIARWIVNAAALLLVAYIYPGVHVSDFWSALFAAIILGLVNAIIRPLLIILTLPATILTLGLFIFVINALLFWLVAEIVRGFGVDGFVSALIGSILYSVITLITSWLLFSKRG